MQPASSEDNELIDVPVRIAFTFENLPGVGLNPLEVRCVVRPVVIPARISRVGCDPDQKFEISPIH